ncbi:MAG TPA: response regulator transcription factor [Miltoncostaeaceae bacterium]|nr:response regulator transcription factor [Miltoncostaeaceae bacterium]
MTTVDAARELERGRDAFADLAWGDALRALERADRDAPLGGEDLERLATSAYMLGRFDDFLGALERAHRAHADGGDPLRAARCATFLGLHLAVRGEMGRATGWFGRAQRLVEAEERESAERGYLLLPVAIQSEMAGDNEAGLAAAESAAEVALRFRDPDLLALAVQLQGRNLIKGGRVEEGLALLDEAMLAVAAEELAPIITGIVYCGVIAGCEEAYDLRRAQEWTDALSRWCERQPEMVAFSGRCLAHRAEIMQVHGAWGDALAEAHRARERCERAMSPMDAGQALYLQGEVHRLRGDFAAAEDAYRDANRSGREPQPGLALLRLAQGDARAAGGAIHRAIAESAEPLERARLLPACAEIAVAAGDAEAARGAADELAEIAGRYRSPMLSAISGQVLGAVELAEGAPSAALLPLRRALRIWQELGAPYEAARTRVLVGMACRALGDEDTAGLELEAARGAFEQLGAAPDLARIAPAAGRQAHDLTPRELDVLRLVAAGRSNRQIAAELVVSEHTVARHVQNILAKLRVPSRTAAAAFAFEHGLL